MAAPPEPDPFGDSFTAAITARALSTAVVLGVFDALAERVGTAAGLAARLSLDPLGTETLCTALTSIGYLERGDEGVLRNAPVSERLLVRSSPESIATFVGAQADLHWEILSVLPESVRSGRAYAMHEERRDPDRWNAYIRGYTRSPATSTTRMPRWCRRSSRRCSSTWPAATEASRWRCAAAITISRRPSSTYRRRPRWEGGSWEEEGFADRVRFREGDVFEVGLGADLDVVPASTSSTIWPSTAAASSARWRALLCARWMPRDRRQRAPGPERPAPRAGAISSVLFYGWSHGHNFTREEIAGWLERAGFSEAETHRNERSPWRIVVIGSA